MSNTIDDGGQAFPHGDPSNGGDIGMTMRDYFAAKAMQALLSNDKPISLVPHLFANEAGLSYLIADAMLAERIK